MQLPFDPTEFWTNNASAVPAAPEDSRRDRGRRWHGAGLHSLIFAILGGIRGNLG